MNLQSKRVLQYMVLVQPINPLLSWKEVGVYRLAARIHDLRQLGFPILDRWKKLKNKYGEPVRVKEYFIKDKTTARLLWEKLL